MGAPPHPLRGGIRRDLLRMLRLQFLQAAQHPVIFIVGDGGRVQHIVEVAVVVELLAQFLHLLAVIHKCLLGGFPLPAQGPALFIT